MLRRAVRTIHADKRWWHAIGLAGLFSLTLFGHPLAAGLVVEHMDNTRKGYASPLPPFYDWTTRWLMGLFAVLVDFVYYVMPLMVMGLLFFCGGLTLLMARSEEGQFATLGVIGGALIAWWLFVFLSGISAVGRLVYVDDGGPDRALTGFPLREVVRPYAWRYYAKARIQSLPLYIAPLLCLGLVPLVLRLDSLVGIAGTLVLLWVMCSALAYAHIGTMLIYGEVNQELQDSAHARPLLGR